jgi:hypothetical protein
MFYENNNNRKQMENTKDKPLRLILSGSLDPSYPERSLLVADD